MHTKPYMAPFPPPQTMPPQKKSPNIYYFGLNKHIITFKKCFPLLFLCSRGLKKSNLNSAKGLETISFSMLLSLTPDEIQNLVSMANEILNDGTVPDSWRRIKVVSVP